MLMPVCQADVALPSLSRRVEAPKKMIDPPAAVELRPPSRELGVAGTADVLRRLRRDHGLFAELSLGELEDYLIAQDPAKDNNILP